MSLTLYYHPLASYCHKVLIALYENGTKFDRRVIDLGNDSDRAELEAIWPMVKFPVIRDHGRHRAVAETSIIIEYLDHHFPGARPLIPREWESALQVRLWDRYFDNYVHGPMQHIVGARMRGENCDSTKERSTLETAYAAVDRHMDAKTWVAGQDFSMADCAAAPALFFASTLVPFPDQFDALKAYWQRLTGRPSFHRVLEEAKPYFSLYPFVEAIPKRYL